MASQSARRQRILTACSNAPIAWPDDRPPPARPAAVMPWSAFEASAAIEEIVADEAAHFQAERFWLSHPCEDGRPDGMANLYFDAAGMIWGLDHLGRVAHAPRLVSRAAAVARSQRRRVRHKAVLGARRLPTGRSGRRARRHADRNVGRCRRPRARALREELRAAVRELMWGLPGSMLACVNTHAMTGEPRWRRLFAAQAGAPARRP
jgi:hypothetical protein